MGQAMSERETYQEAKKTLAEIQHILATEALTERERHELQVHAAALAGVILRPWLPVSWGRRFDSGGDRRFGCTASTVGW
jgi:hypothetical protein